MLISARFIRSQVLTVARLYHIVLGRMPDPSGLSHALSKSYHDDLRQELTDGLLASEEFRIRLGERDARAFLISNAGCEPSNRDVSASLPIWFAILRRATRPSCH